MIAGDPEPRIGWRQAVDRNRLDALLGAARGVTDYAIDAVADTDQLRALPDDLRNEVRHELETALLALQRAENRVRRP